MTTSATLLVDGRVHGGPHRALLVSDGVIRWLGQPDDGLARFPGAEVVRLGGALVTPAFVDAHVHATSTGLLLTGLDLTTCTSLRECLDAIRRFARSTPAPLVWGHGWDETRWPERRPPTRAELDDAVDGRPAYLSRVDVHSALVSTALRGEPGGAGWSADGPLSQDAHHDARSTALATVSPAQRRAAQRAFLDHAAAHGVGSVHECGGPVISSADDLADLRDVVAPAHGVDVVPYWGELATSAEHARELLSATGAHGLAGDLFCDGAVGSRTAAVHAPYLDAPHTCGATYLDPDRVAAHVVACTEARAQAGFHVIGDAAMTAVVDGFTLAEARVGADALRARRHRLEHVEMVTADQAAALARWGVAASVQPVFDALWGGPDGMYAARLGPGRAATMNPLRLLHEHGVRLAFGSDAPVTAVGPWTAIAAATGHRTAASAVPADVAFDAHTTGGHHAARRDGGVLTVGAPATYAVWHASDTDAAGAPRCVRTAVGGRVVFETEGALS